MLSDHLPYLSYISDLKILARYNRHQLTSPEQLLWQKALRVRQCLGYKFLRQKPIDRFIVDFYCSELGLVVEVDGDSHAYQESYDVERTERLKALGLLVIRYANDEVLKNLDGVMLNLQEQIMKRKEGIMEGNPSNSPYQGRT